jgi:hypothetical protein
MSVVSGVFETTRTVILYQTAVLFSFPPPEYLPRACLGKHDRFQNGETLRDETAGLICLSIPHPLPWSGSVLRRYSSICAAIGVRGRSAER